MATAATKEKLDLLVGVADMTLAEIKFVLKHWDESPRRLHSSVIRSVKALDHIPPAVQLSLIDASEKAVRAIGTLMCEEGQGLVVDEFIEDAPTMARHANEFKTIHEKLWKYLSDSVKGNTQFSMRPVLVKRLIARKDCPPLFAKAAGYSKSDFEKAQMKNRVSNSPAKARRPRATEAEPVKARRPRSADTTNRVKTVKGGDDFDDPRGVAKHARTVRRPRV